MPTCYLYSFILINNLMGLIPFPSAFWSKCYRNIAVTFVLAYVLFLLPNLSGNKTTGDIFLRLGCSIVASSRYDPR